MPNLTALVEGVAEALIIATVPPGARRRRRLRSASDPLCTMALASHRAAVSMPQVTRALSTQRARRSSLRVRLRWRF